MPEAGAVVGELEATEAEVLPVPVEPVPVEPVEEEPLKVEPMSPNLMLEKVTDALELTDSTVAGTPEVAEQVPRATPGSVAGLSVG